MSKILFIAFVLLLVSCKKDFSYNPEEGMTLGKTSILSKVSLLDSQSAYIKAELELIHFNGLSTPADYSILSVENDTFLENITTIESRTTVNASSANGYRHIFLVNTDNKIWLEEFAPGYYLDRYFKQVEASNSAHVALASYGDNSGNDIIYYTENNTSIFNNSAEFNSESFLTLTRTNHAINDPNYENNETNFLQTLEVLDELIDSLDNYALPGQSLGITVFANGNYHSTSGSDDPLFALLEKTKMKGVTINFISQQDHYHNLLIAGETGGYHFSGTKCEVEPGIYGPCYSAGPDDRGVLLQNYHNLLANAYNRELVTVKLEYMDTLYFQSLNFVEGSIQFDHSRFQYIISKTP